MREILFRGKEADSGLWCYGDLSFSRDRKTYIRFWAHNGYLVREVMPETVGQFTGFVDKNKKRIFEDDILASTQEEENVVHELVLWYNNGWHIRWKQTEPDEILQQDMDRYSEIVGNIWDNPELLEVGR